MFPLFEDCLRLLSKVVGDGQCGQCASPHEECIWAIFYGYMASSIITHQECGLIMAYLGSIVNGRDSKV